jgi:hypothetical protein
MARGKLVGGLALMAALLAACSSSKASAVDMVRKSAATTLATGTATLTFTQTSDDSGSPVTSTGDGGYQLATKAGRLNLVLKGVPGVPDGSKADAIIDGTTVYAHLLTGADNLKKVGVTAPWIKLDLRSLSSIPGLSLGTIAEAQSANPDQFLLFLKGAVDPVTKVGTETVSKVSTTHYKFDVDLDQAAAKTTGDDDATVNKAIATYTGTKIPTEVWIDNSGLVRRLAYTFEVKPGAGKTTPVHQMTSFEFQQFGTPVDAAAPPANQVADVTSFLGKLALG